MKRPRTGYKIARDSTTAALKREMAEQGKAEYRIHCAIVEVLRKLHKPGVVFWHCPNGAKRKPAEAAALKAMGMLPGVADLQISLPNGRMAFVEIKAASGRLSEDQSDFLDRMRRAGHWTAVVRSVDGAMLWFQDWGVIRTVAGAA